MSWRANNEGKACDAVVRHIEAREHATRTDLSRPEREGHSAPVELVCRIGPTLFAFEHTAVEAYPRQIENDVNFQRQMSPVVDALNQHVPADEHWDIILPVEAFAGAKARQLPTLHAAVVAAILDAAPQAAVEPWGAVHWPTSLGPEQNCPVPLRFRRFHLGGFTHKFLPGAHITRSVGPLEAPRGERMRKVCDDKFPKLAMWRALSARTVLILETDDFVISSPEAVAEAYLEAEAGRAGRPDEVYFVWALDGAGPGARWVLSVVRMDDLIGQALWTRGTNLFEIDPASLDDLTAA